MFGRTMLPVSVSARALELLEIIALEEGETIQSLVEELLIEFILDWETKNVVGAS